MNELEVWHQTVCKWRVKVKCYYRVSLADAKRHTSQLKLKWINNIKKWGVKHSNCMIMNDIDGYVIRFYLSNDNRFESLFVMDKYPLNKFVSNSTNFLVKFIDIAYLMRATLIERLKFSGCSNWMIHVRWVTAVHHHHHIMLYFQEWHTWTTLNYCGVFCHFISKDVHAISQCLFQFLVSGLLLPAYYLGPMQHVMFNKVLINQKPRATIASVGRYATQHILFNLAYDHVDKD